MEKAMAVVVAYGNKVRPWEEFGWLPNRVNERERERGEAKGLPQERRKGRAVNIGASEALHIVV